MIIDHVKVFAECGLVLRSAEPRDLHFVADSWRKSYRDEFLRGEICYFPDHADTVIAEFKRLNDDNEAIDGDGSKERHLQSPILNALYTREMARIVQTLMASADICICVDIEDNNQILAYIVVENQPRLPPCIHYINVKYHVRKYDIATSLISFVLGEDKLFHYSFSTRGGQALLDYIRTIDPQVVAEFHPERALSDARVPLYMSKTVRRFHNSRKKVGNDVSKESSKAQQDSKAEHHSTDS